jgi:hypothetical protein
MACAREAKIKRAVALRDGARRGMNETLAGLVIFKEETIQRA